MGIPGVKILSLCLALFALSAHGEIYRWTDENGQVHYSDQKPDGLDSESVVLKQKQRSTEDINAQLERIEREKKYLEERSEARRKNAAEQARAKQKQARNRKACLEARKQYDVVLQKRPVYIDQEGKYRVAWGDDVYTGERDYVEDGDRLDLIKKKRSEIERFCSDPDDAKAQELARMFQILDEDCETEQAILEQLTNRGRRNPEGQIEKQRQKTDYICGLRR